jgi:hypothetical protein
MKKIFVLCAAILLAAASVTLSSQNANSPNGKNAPAAVKAKGATTEASQAWVFRNNRWLVSYSSH